MSEHPFGTKQAKVELLARHIPTTLPAGAPPLVCLGDSLALRPTLATLSTTNQRPIAWPLREGQRLQRRSKVQLELDCHRAPLSRASDTTRKSLPFTRRRKMRSEAQPPWRYLHMSRRGGVYLDFKCGLLRPLWSWLLELQESCMEHELVRQGEARASGFYPPFNFQSQGALRQSPHHKSWTPIGDS